LTFYGKLLHKLTRQTLCILPSTSKPAHNRYRRNFALNSRLFLNPWIYFDVLRLLLHKFSRHQLRITLSASKPAHNRERRNFDRNSPLLLNRWRYFDVLGILLLNITRQTLCIPLSVSKPAHNRERRNFDRNSLLFLNRWRYFDVLRQTFAQTYTPNVVHNTFNFETSPYPRKTHFSPKFAVIPQPLEIF
jgi:hypothetical protein